MFLKKKKRPDGSHFHLYLSQRQANSPVYVLQNSSKQQIKTEYTSVTETRTHSPTLCAQRLDPSLPRLILLGEFGKRLILIAIMLGSLGCFFFFSFH